MLIVTPSTSTHYRDGPLPKEGRTPLKIESEGGRYLLVQYHFEPDVRVEDRRQVLSEHATERAAEQAALAFVDGPPPPRKPARKSVRSTAAVKRVHAAIVKSTKEHVR